MVIIFLNLSVHLWLKKRDAINHVSNYNFVLRKLNQTISGTIYGAR